MEYTNWHTSSQMDDLQGIITEEHTGKTIAVSYDVKDAALIAAAPKLLYYLEVMIKWTEETALYLLKDKELLPRGFDNAKITIAEAKGE